MERKNAEDADTALEDALSRTSKIDADAKAAVFAAVAAAHSGEGYGFGAKVRSLMEKLARPR